MFGTQTKRIQTDDDDLDITPMIDVTFLLLIFFMVTSNMQQSASLQIPPAENGQGVPSDKSTIITIFRTEGGSEIYLADEKKENGPVDASEVTRYVQEGIDANKYNVIIKADRDLPSEIVDEVARAANDAEVPGGELKFYFGVTDRPK